MTRITTLLFLTTLSVTLVTAEDGVRMMFVDVAGPDSGYPQNTNDTQGEMDKWFNKMDERSGKLVNAIFKARWARRMDLNNKTKSKLYTSSVSAFSKFSRMYVANATKMTSDPAFKYNEDTYRRVELLRSGSFFAHNESFTDRNLAIKAQLKTLFWKGKVCPYNETNGTHGETETNGTKETNGTTHTNGTTDTNGTKCLTIVPGLQEIMKVTNLDTLKWAWQGWRDVSGGKMRSLYTELISLQNQAARDNDFADEGDHWRKANFGSGIEAIAEKMYEQVKPLYRELFGYVRRKLLEKYGAPSGIRLNGPIPAHVLGDMMAAHWNNLLTNGVIQPYPDVPPNDVTKEMKRQKYTVRKMFKMAEEFFTSIGLFKMNEGFWKNSMFVKPTDRKIDCIPSASDFRDGKDFRLDI